MDEALALIISYEALVRYQVSPFSAEGVAAVTKLRAALPTDVVRELDTLREHVAFVEPVRDYDAPLLRDLLSAAVDGVHLTVTYDSVRSGGLRAGDFPFRGVRVAGILVLRLPRLQEGNEPLLEGGPLPLGLQRGRARHVAATPTHSPQKLDARGKGRPRGDVGAQGLGERAGREKLRAGFPAR